MNTNTFSIQVDIHMNSLREQASPEGILQANFYILIGGVPYPSNPWLDFPVVVLSWWLNSYKSMIQTGELMENSFMNGSFEFKGQLADDQVHLTFWKRTRSESLEVRSPFNLSLKQYKSALIDAADNLIDLLEKFSIDNADLRNLKIANNSVKELSK